jgi:hypothetical protein
LLKPTTPLLSHCQVFPQQADAGVGRVDICPGETQQLPLPHAYRERHEHHCVERSTVGLRCIEQTLQLGMAQNNECVLLARATSNEVLPVLVPIGA